jgi:hypothetical protein
MSASREPIEPRYADEGHARAVKNHTHNTMRRIVPSPPLGPYPQDREWRHTGAVPPRAKSRTTTRTMNSMCREAATDVPSVYLASEIARTLGQACGRENAADALRRAATFGPAP